SGHRGESPSTGGFVPAGGGGGGVAPGSLPWYESVPAWITPRPLPPRMKSMNALRRLAVTDSLAGSSRYEPVVLARKMPSYCWRFSAVITAGSYEITVVHAPVLSPRASIVLAASGIDECTNPDAFASTSTRRGVLGAAGALSGNAAIICMRS